MESLSIITLAARKFLYSACFLRHGARPDAYVRSKMCVFEGTRVSALEVAFRREHPPLSSFLVHAPLLMACERHSYGTKKRCMQANQRPHKHTTCDECAMKRDVTKRGRYATQWMCTLRIAVDAESANQSTREPHQCTANSKQSGYAVNVVGHDARYLVGLIPVPEQKFSARVNRTDGSEPEPHCQKNKKIRHCFFLIPSLR